MIMLFSLNRGSSCTCRGTGLFVMIDCNEWAMKAGMSANEK